MLVLVLENRSFDHVLGFSCIKGIDAVTGPETGIGGLTGRKATPLAANSTQFRLGADYRLPTDRGHEFHDVVRQLCGPLVQEPGRRPYPPIDDSGFVASYVASHGVVPGEIIKY